MLLGMMQVVIGIYGITSTKHNFFMDYLLLPILLTWYFLCVLVHKFCVFAGSKIGIWRVKPQNAASAAEDKKDQDIDLKMQTAENEIDLETGTLVSRITYSK